MWGRKSKFGRKIFLCFFSFLISLFPYAHAHGLFFPSLSTRTRFVFGRKKNSFLPFVMPTHTILFFPYYTHAWGFFAAQLFFGTTHAHLLPLLSMASASLKTLSLPPAFRPLHRHPRTPAPLSTAGAHVSLSLASPPASVRFCSSHQCPYPPAPIDLLTTDDVPYRFVVDEGNVLHSIRMLCFPCRGRRHPHAFSQPVLTSHISWSSSSVRALSVRGLGHLVRPWCASRYRIDERSSSLLRLLDVRYCSHQLSIHFLFEYDGYREPCILNICVNKDPWSMISWIFILAMDSRRPYGDITNTWIIVKDNYVTSQLPMMWS